MFFRRTKVANGLDGKSYYTYRLVENQREGTKFRQKTILNLGANWGVPQSDWKAVAQRVEAIQHGQISCFEYPKRISEPDTRRALALVAAKMIHPASERETSRWIKDNSSLPELLGLTKPRESVNLLSKVTLICRPIMPPLRDGRTVGEEPQPDQLAGRTIPIFSMQIIPGCLSIAAR